MAGGFDPKAYLAEDSGGGFDPKAYLAEGDHGMDMADVGGAGQAALEHFGNAAAMGYLPHLQALAAKATPNPSAKVDAELAARGFKIQQPEDGYLSNRDANIRRLVQQSTEHPYASAAGTVGGVIAGGALTGSLLPAGAPATLGGGMVGPVTRGANLLNEVKNGLKAGAIYGALANPGDTEDEIDPLQLGARAKGGAIGGAVGGAIPVAVEGVKQGAGALRDYLQDKAALKAARSLGRPTPTQAAKMAESGQDKVIGRELLDSGAIPWLGTPGRIAERVDALKEKVGQTINDLIDKGGDSKMIDAQKLGVEILDSPELAAMRKTPGMESTVSAIEKQVETLAKNGQMTLKEAQALRQGIDKSINFNKAAPDMRGAQEGLFQQRTAIRDAMNDAVNGLPNAPGKDALLAANRRYSNLSTASDILDREVARDQANRAISLTDTIAGAAGMAHGSPAAALALGAINKAGRTFGNSIQARGYDAVSKGLPAVARAAGAVGANPMIVQSVAQALANPRDDRSAPQALDDETLGVFRANPTLIDSVSDPKLKRAIQKGLGQTPTSQTQAVDRAPSGEAKWAQRGAQTLGLSDQDARSMMNHPQGKQLLIQASDLKPGSPAMRKVQSQIQAILKGNSR